MRNHVLVSCVVVASLAALALHLLVTVGTAVLILSVIWGLFALGRIITEALI